MGNKGRRGCGDATGDPVFFAGGSMECKRLLLVVLFAAVVSIRGSSSECSLTVCSKALLENVLREAGATESHVKYLSILVEEIAGKTLGTEVVRSELTRLCAELLAQMSGRVDDWSRPDLRKERINDVHAMVDRLLPKILVSTF